MDGAPEQPRHCAADRGAEEAVHGQTPGCLAAQSDGQGHGACGAGHHEGEVDRIAHHEQPGNGIFTCRHGGGGDDRGQHARRAGIRGDVAEDDAEQCEQSGSHIGGEIP